MVVVARALQSCALVDEMGVAYSCTKFGFRLLVVSGLLRCSLLYSSTVVARPQ